MEHANRLSGRALGLGRRARRGDRSAFEQIFRHHGDELYRYCLAIVRNRDDAEDALQSTMGAALRSLPGEGRDIELRPWLFRVAHNESISIIRRRTTVALDDTQVSEPEGASQEDRIAIRERMRRLLGDLAELPERQRSALVMRELSGISYGEIGGALDCSEAAARQAVYEARLGLKNLEEGRTLACEEVMHAISFRDGRRLRNRRLRAHLRACDRCTAFAADIPRRRADLDAVFPALPAAATGSIISGVLGGAGGATGVGAGATGFAGGAAASVAVKVASVVAAVAIAGGAAGYSGLIDLPNPLGNDSERVASSPATDDGAAAADAGPNASPDTGRSGDPRGDGSAASGPTKGNGNRGGGEQGTGGGGNGSATSPVATPSGTSSDSGGPLSNVGDTGQPLVDDVVDTAQGATNDPVGTVNDAVEGTGLLPGDGSGPTGNLPVQVPNVGDGLGLGIGK